MQLSQVLRPERVQCYLNQFGAYLTLYLFTELLVFLLGIVGLDISYPASESARAYLGPLLLSLETFIVYLVIIKKFEDVKPALWYSSLVLAIFILIFAILNPIPYHIHLHICNALLFQFNLSAKLYASINECAYTHRALWGDWRIHIAIGLILALFDSRIFSTHAAPFKVGAMLNLFVNVLIVPLSVKLYRGSKKLEEDWQYEYNEAQVQQLRQLPNYRTEYYNQNWQIIQSMRKMLDNNLETSPYPPSLETL